MHFFETQCRRRCLDVLNMMIMPIVSIDACRCRLLLLGSGMSKEDGGMVECLLVGYEKLFPEKMPGLENSEERKLWEQLANPDGH